MDPLHDRAVTEIPQYGDECIDGFITQHPFYNTREGQRFCRMLNNTSPGRIAELSCDGVDFPDIYTSYREVLRSQAAAEEAVGLLNEAIDKIYVWFQSNFSILPDDFAGVGEYKIQTEQANSSDPDSPAHSWMWIGGLYVLTLNDHDKKDLEKGRVGIAMGRIDEIETRLRMDFTFKERSWVHGSSDVYACMLSKLKRSPDPFFKVPRANVKYLTKAACQAFERQFNYDEYSKRAVVMDLKAAAEAAGESGEGAVNNAAFQFEALHKYGLDLETALKERAGSWVIVNDDAEFDVDMPRVRETLDQIYAELEFAIHFLNGEQKKVGGAHKSMALHIVHLGLDELYQDPNSIYQCRPVAIRESE